MTDPTCADTATPGARRELHQAGSHNERQSRKFGICCPAGGGAGRGGVRVKWFWRRVARAVSVEGTLA